MLCPYCNSSKNKATGMQRIEKVDLNADKRYRECLDCGETFKTVETIGDVNVKTTKYKQRVTVKSALFQSKVSLQRLAVRFR